MRIKKQCHENEIFAVSCWFLHQSAAVATSRREVPGNGCPLVVFNDTSVTHCTFHATNEDFTNT